MDKNTRDVIDGLRAAATVLTEEGYPHRADLMRDAIAEIERLAAMVDATHSAEPVDWPTEPGWWWMRTNRMTDFSPIWFSGSVVKTFHSQTLFTRCECESFGTRFLPLPTFPPRETQ